MTITATCPFCDWTARQATGHQDQALITTYLAKGLMDHLRLKHSRHDEARLQNIAFSTILSQRTKMGMIEFSFDDAMSQWDLDKAREIHRMLGEAIEAAVSDTLIYQFLIAKVGLDHDKAAMALLDFRELRQGSKDVVRPQSRSRTSNSARPGAIRAAPPTNTTKANYGSPSRPIISRASCASFLGSRWAGSASPPPRRARWPRCSSRKPMNSMPGKPKPPVFVHTARTDDRACPVCFKSLDAATGMSLDPDDPQPRLEVDAITLCVYCRTLLVVTTLGFRVASADDINQIDPLLRQVMFEFIAHGPKL